MSAGMYSRITRTFKNFLVISLSLVLVSLLAIVVFAQFFLEPLLRKQIHTLIIEGSDGLYKYSLGNLNADFLGGSVEVEDFQLSVDSLRYQELKADSSLPTLIMHLDLKKGHVRGIGLIALLAGKKISIEEIMSKEADIVLTRHVSVQGFEKKQNLPLWKSMQPSLKKISVENLRLEGVSLLYHNADTTESVQFAFEKFDAAFEDIVIDSASAFDSSRIGFARSVNLKFHQLSFLSADSMYKMSASAITYSSDSRRIAVQRFRLQPTLTNSEFYLRTGLRKSLYNLEFDSVLFVNAPLEKYLHQNKVESDSIIIESPRLKIYLDKSQERVFSVKTGSYPHLQIARSPIFINVRNMLLRNASLVYTEKNGNSGLEGQLPIEELDVYIHNITNQPSAIALNSTCTALARGKILGSSPIETAFSFFLDSSSGRFDLEGSVKNISAAQLNPLSVPLANIRLTSLNINELKFWMKVDEHSSLTDVDLGYNSFAIELSKTDASTGAVKKMRFLNRALNNHMIYSSNPSSGSFRRARGVKFMRLTTQPFFGVIWKSLFGGMQQVMMQSGNLGI